MNKPNKLINNLNFYNSISRPCPYISNRNIDLIYNISYAYMDRADDRSYNLDEFNTAIGFKYDLTNKISHSVILE